MLSPRYFRYPAQVLGCLRNSFLTVIACKDVGMANGGINGEIPIHLVPVDLRMPNSEFDIVLDRFSESLSVLRKGEPHSIEGDE